jgi:hypothetical protein
MFCRLSLQKPITRPSDDEKSNEHADPASNVHQSNGSSGETVDFLKDEGVGCVEKIKHPIHQCAIYRHQTDNWREEEHLDRPDNGSLDTAFLGETVV